jgi:hypothetical protein
MPARIHPAFSSRSVRICIITRAHHVSDGPLVIIDAAYVASIASSRRRPNTKLVPASRHTTNISELDTTFAGNRAKLGYGPEYLSLVLCSARPVGVPVARNGEESP